MADYVIGDWGFVVQGPVIVVFRIEENNRKLPEALRASVAVLMLNHRGTVVVREAVKLLYAVVERLD